MGFRPRLSRWLHRNGMRWKVLLFDACLLKGGQSNEQGMARQSPDTVRRIACQSMFSYADKVQVKTCHATRKALMTADALTSVPVDFFCGISHVDDDDDNDDDEPQSSPNPAG